MQGLDVSSDSRVDDREPRLIEQCVCSLHAMVVVIEELLLATMIAYQQRLEEPSTSVTCTQGFPVGAGCLLFVVACLSGSGACKASPQSLHLQQQFR